MRLRIELMYLNRCTLFGNWSILTRAVALLKGKDKKCRISWKNSNAVSCNANFIERKFGLFRTFWRVFPANSREMDFSIKNIICFARIQNVKWVTNVCFIGIFRDTTKNNFFFSKCTCLRIHCLCRTKIGNHLEFSTFSFSLKVTKISHLEKHYKRLFKGFFHNFEQISRNII